MFATVKLTRPFNKLKAVASSARQFTASCIADERQKAASSRDFDMAPEDLVGKDQVSFQPPQLKRFDIKSVKSVIIP